VGYAGRRGAGRSALYHHEYLALPFNVRWAWRRPAGPFVEKEEIWSFTLSSI